MGSCISKCMRKKKFKEDCSCSHVHDKLVISQDHAYPKSSIPSNPTPPTKLKPTITPSQSSSFSCLDNSKACATMVSSISSSSSCNSSSVLIGAKDGSFSNEFLWSCVKENPHIVGVKQSLENPKRTPLQNLEHSMEFSPFVTRTKHSVHENLTASTPKKRARANSPTLVRQKSFRKGQNRGLRSPSPTRKFIGENNRSFSADANSCKGPIFPKAIATNSLSYSVKKESFRPPAASPNRNFAIKRDVSESTIFRGSSKPGGPRSKRPPTSMDLLKSVKSNLDLPVCHLLHEITLEAPGGPPAKTLRRSSQRSSLGIIKVESFFRDKNQFPSHGEMNALFIGETRRV